MLLGLHSNFRLEKFKMLAISHFVQSLIVVATRVKRLVYLYVEMIGESGASLTKNVFYKLW